MVAPASRRISRVLRYSGFRPPAPLSGTGLSPLSSAFPDRSPAVWLVVVRPFNPDPRVGRFGLLGVRSPLLAESSLFLALLRCFSWRTYPSLSGVIPHKGDRVSPFGHRRFISPAHGWAALFAVYHVLPRRLAARHPPDALPRLQPRAAEKLTLSHVNCCVYALVKLLRSCLPRPSPLRSRTPNALPPSTKTARHRPGCLHILSFTLRPCYPVV